MSFDDQAIHAIKEIVITVGDGRYRKISDCDDITEAMSGDIKQHNADIAAIKVYLRIILWVFSAVSTLGIGLLWKIAFGG